MRKANSLNKGAVDPRKYLSRVNHEEEYVRLAERLRTSTDRPLTSINDMLASMMTWPEEKIRTTKKP